MPPQEQDQADDTQMQEALGALLILGEASSNPGNQEAEIPPLAGNNSRAARERRQPKRLAEEVEGPQWGSPENPTYHKKKSSEKLPRSSGRGRGRGRS